MKNPALKHQDINLLTSAPSRSSPRPTGRQFTIAILTLTCLGVVIGVWQEHRRSSLERRVVTLNADIDNLVANLEERSYSLAEHNADPVLVAELQRREREAEDKSRVLSLLSGESVGNTDGFSGHLAALGRRHPEGLWLEGIHIGAGGRQLMLVGRTLRASLVPRFLSELQVEPALAGTAFASFTMAGEDSGHGALRFALATGCEPQGTVDAVDSTDTGDGDAPEECVSFDDPFETGGPSS